MPFYYLFPMAYNEALIERLRSHLAPLGDQISERKMFGTHMFMYLGKGSIGVKGDEFLVRVVKGRMGQGLNRPESSIFAPRGGKGMKETLLIDPEQIKGEEELGFWVDLGLEHAREAAQIERK